MKHKVLSMELKELIQIANIDFTDCLAELDHGTWLGHNFEITPLEFLSFAKADFREGGKKGRINALTNAKRAIDCQIDLIFKSFGYDFDNFPKYLSRFSNYFCNLDRRKSVSAKLKIINAFGMAPARLVGDARALRNKMEHYYNNPEEEDVWQSLEVVELFLSATERKLMDLRYFDLTDSGHKKNREGFISGLHVSQGFDDREFEIRYTCPNTKQQYSSKVSPENESYAPLIRMCMNYEQDEEFRKSLAYLLKINEHRIPEDRVGVCVTTPVYD